MIDWLSSVFELASASHLRLKISTPDQCMISMGPPMTSRLPGKIDVVQGCEYVSLPRV